MFFFCLKCFGLCSIIHTDWFYFFSFTHKGDAFSFCHNAWHEMERKLKTTKMINSHMFAGSWKQKLNQTALNQGGGVGGGWRITNTFFTCLAFSFQIHITCWCVCDTSVPFKSLLRQLGSVGGCFYTNISTH